ncbi:hypothetical protein V1511DRAFT_378290 [Dipodascopsis uninucleata]
MACSCLNDFYTTVKESPVFAVAMVVLASIGAMKLSTLFFKSTRLIAELFILPGTNFAKYGAGKGAWAVLTGASDGIGKEFAMQLAKKKFNVVLISRTESKLIEVANEITEKSKVETKIVPVDFAHATEQDYDRIQSAIADLDVSILINNVGQSHSIPVPFSETDITELENIININDMATLKVTRLVLPRMIARKKPGLVLTMGSFGGLLPTPYLAVYSGSKAFLQYWSSALATELKPHKIDVELVISYLVTSAMSKIKRTSLMIPNPRQFVQSTLSSVGLSRGSQGRIATSTPYWSHALLQFVIENAIGIYSGIVAKINLNMHIDIRRRALKKAERQKKGN